MRAKKFVVDVYRELGQTIEIEARDESEAYEKAMQMAMDGKLKWSLDQFTDSVDANVSGEVDENGERQYY